MKINQRIREIEGVQGLYVQPAMDDAGAALGAALHVAAQLETNAVRGEQVLDSVYQGPGYDEQVMEQCLRESGLVYRRPDDPEAEVARRFREVVGPDVPIVASFDLHGNEDGEFLEHASVPLAVAFAGVQVPVEFGAFELGIAVVVAPLPAGDGRSDGVLQR